jgi:CheY-like chemotaxis protein
MPSSGCFIAADTQLNQQLEEVLKDIVRRRGWLLRRYSSVEQAIPSAAADRAGFSLVSQQETGMTGDDLVACTRRLRDNAPDTPLLILTLDLDSPDVALDCLAAGASDYVVWPDGAGALAEIAGYLVDSLNGDPPFGVFPEVAQLSNPQQEAPPTAFVAMPFLQRIRRGNLGLSTYFEIYRQVIIPTLQRVGWQVCRADRWFSAENIGAQVQEGIRRCQLLLADVSEQNVNVYYEIGYADGVEKLIILTIYRGDALPANLRGRFDIRYANRVELSRKLICALGQWGRVRRQSPP